MDDLVVGGGGAGRAADFEGRQIFAARKCHKLKIIVFNEIILLIDDNRSNLYI